VSRFNSVIVLWCLLSVMGLLPGCQKESRVALRVPPTDEPAPTTAAAPIEINPIQVGAEGKAEPVPPSEPVRPARRFVFLVTGIGVEPTTGSAIDRKSSAIEAAVVEAIGQAAREIQRDPKTGKAPIEYKLDMGSGLTVFGQLVRGAPQTVVLLDRHGRITELCSRSGVLAHPPHGSRTLQSIFAATNGQFVLQSTHPTDQPGQYGAKVGYYRKVDPAMTQTAENSEPPVIARLP